MAASVVNCERHPDYKKIFPLLREVDGAATARARFPHWRVNGHAQNCFGKSSYFLVACENGDLQVAKVLFEMGANVAAKNQYNETALMFACRNCGSRAVLMVTWLLEQKGVRASMDDVDHCKNTALHCAVMNIRVNVEIVRTLLCYGVDRTCRNFWVKTAAEELRSCEKGVMAQLIEDWKEPEIEEWRPWNANRAPASFRTALRSLVVLAKATVNG